MSLSGSDREFIRQNKGRLSARQMARQLGVDRRLIESELGQAPDPAPSPSSPSPASARSLPGWLAPLILIAVHATVFFDHYFSGFGFPNDFRLTAHAVPFYWITCVQSGFFPQWVPFQAMGYPLAMNLQSDIYYPPLWTVVASGQAYSLKTAVILQCLHVLVGAWGAYALARRRGLGVYFALLAAIAYHSFGGFYSNAQHVHIVRTYALIPWVIAGLTLARDKRIDPFQVLCAPLAMYLLWTGGYTGGALAVLALGPLYVASQLLGPGSRFEPSQWRSAAWAVGLLVLGTLMASVQLVPAWIFREELLRYHESAAQEMNFLTLRHLATLVAPYLTDALTLDPSMRSAFVTAPVLIGLAYATRRTFAEHFPLYVLGAAALLVVTGSPLYTLLTKLLPPLGYSRFPSADFRALAALPMTVLAAAHFERLLTDRAAPAAALTRLALGAGAAVALCAVLAPEPLQQASLTSGLLLAAGALIHASLKRASAVRTCLILCAAVAVSGLLYHKENDKTWRVADFEAAYERLYDQFSDDSGTVYTYRKEVVGAAALRARLKTPLTERPARRESQIGFIPDVTFWSWRGYYTGAFMMTDYTSGMQLRHPWGVLRHPFVRSFMTRPSNWLTLAPDTPLTDADQLSSAVAEDRRDRASVRMTRFEPHGSVYEISAGAPFTLVENELHFSGWSGRLSTGQKLDARSAGALLRSWDLPAGDYTLTTRFEMPWLKRSALISLVCTLLWLAWVWRIRRGRPTPAPIPAA